MHHVPSDVGLLPASAEPATSVKSDKLDNFDKVANFASFVLPDRAGSPYRLLMDFTSISIPNPRPLFPEHIATSAPLGTRDRLRRAAQLAGTTSAALIRDAIQDRLRRFDERASEGAL